MIISLERSSRLLHLNKLAAKESRRVVVALTDQLGDYPQALRRTIAYDNSSENVEHQEINEALGTISYFCNPYHCWQKGSVEYAISLIRRFLPKKTDFATVSPKPPKRNRVSFKHQTKKMP